METPPFCCCGLRQSRPHNPSSVITRGDAACRHASCAAHLCLSMQPIYTLPVYPCWPIPTRPKHATYSLVWRDLAMKVLPAGDRGQAEATTHLHKRALSPLTKRVMNKYSRVLDLTTRRRHDSLKVHLTLLCRLVDRDAHIPSASLCKNNRHGIHLAASCTPSAAQNSQNSLAVIPCLAVDRADSTPDCLSL